MATATQKSADVLRMPQREVTFERVGAWFVYVAYKVIVQAGMILIYIGVIADGLRRQFSAFGQKLYRVLPPLKDFELTYRLDFAWLTAVGMAFLVCWAWTRMIEIYLEDNLIVTHKQNREYGLTMVLGVAVLGVDALLFYSSAAEAGWAGTEFSIGAGIATIGYLAFVVLVNFVGVTLKNKTK
jgi:hypothetical protein